ncbi:GTPase-activating protein and VPS9 domain-containing protein 1 [Tyrophagus putrescentiae]|nr:GTPase-activating protein and VPS9 domain-containing protein 1 [Tyrophagus putrescentiae]
MNLVKLIENIHKEHVHVQGEREQIHQLNIDVNDESESTYNLTWIIRNQRYLCDKLNINGHEYLELIDELNQNDNANFVKGYKKFGSNEVFLTQMLQYLASNPKSVSYLLFYAEKSCTGFLDPLCKITLSTVYSHCQQDRDKTAIVDLMEELLEININFYNDFRRQIHSKYSAFCLVYRNFCDELSELKTFYKLALYQPIMQVLSEDNLFLDIDSNRAAMRFLPKERTKHFGIENTDEYRENLIKYKKWTLQKLRTFIGNFISSLRANIFAFPQSLATVIIRVYSKLIEHLEFQQVYAICIDLIFCFLICPAIQNPDLFGITDLHVNHIAHYNLLQCAQIIQLLALSKWESCNSTYQEVCDLFDKDCLSFVIDHILGIFNNFSLPKSIESSPLPYFLISEFELKLFLEYIKLLLSDSDQNDNPIKGYFNSLPESVINFKLDSTKSESLNRKSPVTKMSASEATPSSVELAEVIRSQNEDFVSSYKLLFFNRNILQITNESSSPKMIGLLKEKDFIAKIREKDVGISDEVDLLVKKVEGLFLEDMYTHLTEIKFNNKSQVDVCSETPSLIDCASTNLDFLSAFNHRQIDCSFKENLSGEDLSLNYNNNRELKPELLDLPSSNVADQPTITFDTVDKSPPTLLLDLDSPTLNTARSTNQPKPETDDALIFETLPSPNEEKFIEPLQSSITNETSTTASSQRRGSTHKKGFFSISNFKNIKDKVKNISIKDNKLRSSVLDSEETGNSSANILSSVLKESKFDIANVKAKTSEILAKYKNNNKSASEELLSLNTPEPGHESLIEVGDQVDNESSLPVDHFCHILLSQAQNMDEVSNMVLIIDMIRCLKSTQMTLRREQYITNFIVVSFLVRQLMERKDVTIQQLMAKVGDASMLPDEKVSLVERLVQEMAQCAECRCLTEEQHALAKQIIERHLIGRIYLSVFYSNGDIDKMRDQLLHQEISQLSTKITPSSRLIKIPSKYFTTAPWLSAQAELWSLSAYKTAHDKVQCIHRCCSHIITLLSTSDSTIPSADDLLPVLIFVVIKANPTSILSTIQYVNSFYSKELFGEEAYYWTQFCSVVEFIKTVINQPNSE